MTREQLDFEKLSKAMDQVEDALESIDCDEAFALFVHHRVEIEKLAKEWLYLCANCGDR